MKLGRCEGREHTIRAGHTQHSTWINGINGVTGLQYINSSYGRTARERQTGIPEPDERIRFSVSYTPYRHVIALVKDGMHIEGQGWKCGLHMGGQDQCGKGSWHATHMRVHHGVGYWEIHGSHTNTDRIQHMQQLQLTTYPPCNSKHRIAAT